MNRTHLRRPDIDNLKKYGLEFQETWEVVDHFEKLVADFFGSPYAVATDCCTHAIELSVIVSDSVDSVAIPRWTYMSIPMMFDKLKIPYRLTSEQWQDYYQISPLPVYDAAVAWKENSYIPGSLMCLSFQFKKHLPIGRGGMILLDDPNKYERLQRLVRDGRNRKLLAYNDDIQEAGYHYYMTPEDAARGIDLFYQVKNLPRRIDQHHIPTGYQDYKDLLEITYFKQKCQ